MEKLNNFAVIANNLRRQGNWEGISGLNELFSPEIMIERRSLSGQKGFMSSFDGRVLVAISDELGEEEASRLTAHMLGHIILGHLELEQDLRLEGVGVKLAERMEREEQLADEFAEILLNASEGELYGQSIMLGNQLSEL